MENVVWEENSYAALGIITEEHCKQACLDDCKCNAVFFKDRSRVQKARVSAKIWKKVTN